MSETDRFLNALRSNHPNVSRMLGDEGLYGAMANYTGQSHLGDAVKSDILNNALFGAGTGALTTSLIFPALGMAISPKANKYGLLYGAGAGAALSTLDSIAKYYLGRTASGLGQGE